MTDELRNEQLLRDIEKIGRSALGIWRKQREKKKDGYLNKWEEGFLYFIGSMSYRGRPDALSEQIAKRARGRIEPYFMDRGNDLERIRSDIKPTDDLIARDPIGLAAAPDGGVIPRADMQMIYGALRATLESIRDHNFVSYAKKSLESGDNENIEKCYKDIHAVPQVADKLTCMFLRDVLILYDLEAKVPQTQMHRFLPVDTWVRQLCQKLQIATEQDKDEQVKDKIIKKCNSFDPPLSAIAFDHGLWRIAQLRSCLLDYEMLAENLVYLKSVSEFGLFDRES